MTSVPYNREAYVNQIRFLLKKTAEAIIEAGKMLLVMKEREGYGNFCQILEEEIGIPVRTAYRFMSTAIKAEKYPVIKTFAKLAKVSQVYTLLEAPEERLRELEERGMLAGKTMDELQRMTVKEMRDLIRQSRMKEEVEEDETPGIIEKFIAGTEPVLKGQLLQEGESATVPETPEDDSLPPPPPEDEIRAASNEQIKRWLDTSPPPPDRLPMPSYDGKESDLAIPEYEDSASSESDPRDQAPEDNGFLVKSLLRLEGFLSGEILDRLREFSTGKQELLIRHIGSSITFLTIRDWNKVFEVLKTEDETELIEGLKRIREFSIYDELFQFFTLLEGLKMKARQFAPEDYERIMEKFYYELLINILSELASLRRFNGKTENLVQACRDVFIFTDDPDERERRKREFALLMNSERDISLN
jgi:hypothetical protein